MSSDYPETERYKKEQKKQRDAAYRDRRSASFNRRRVIEATAEVSENNTRSQERVMRAAFQGQQRVMQEAFQGQHRAVLHVAGLGNAFLDAPQNQPVPRRSTTRYDLTSSPTGSETNQSRFEDSKTEETSDDEVQVVDAPDTHVAFYELDSDDEKFEQVKYTMTPAKTPGGSAVFTPVTETDDSLKARIRALEQETNGLKQENNGLRQENNGLKQEIAGLKQENSGLKQEVDGLQQEKLGLAGRVQSLEQGNDHLEQEKPAKRGRIF